MTVFGEGAPVRSAQWWDTVTGGEPSRLPVEVPGAPPAVKKLLAEHGQALQEVRDLRAAQRRLEDGRKTAEAADKADGAAAYRAGNASFVSVVHIRALEMELTETRAKIDALLTASKSIERDITDAVAKASPDWIGRLNEADQAACDRARAILDELTTLLEGRAERSAATAFIADGAKRWRQPQPTGLNSVNVLRSEFAPVTDELEMVRREP